MMMMMLILLISVHIPTHSHCVLRVTLPASRPHFAEIPRTAKHIERVQFALCVVRTRSLPGDFCEIMWNYAGFMIQLSYLIYF